MKSLLTSDLYSRRSPKKKSLYTQTDFRGPGNHAPVRSGGVGQGRREKKERRSPPLATARAGAAKAGSHQANLRRVGPSHSGRRRLGLRNLHETLEMVGSSGRLRSRDPAEASASLHAVKGTIRHPEQKDNYRLGIPGVAHRGRAEKPGRKLQEACMDDFKR